MVAVVVMAMYALFTAVHSIWSIVASLIIFNGKSFLKTYFFQFVLKRPETLFYFYSFCQINLKGIKNKTKRKPVINIFRYLDLISSLSCYIIIFKHDLHYVLVLILTQNHVQVCLKSRLISSYLVLFNSFKLFKLINLIY